MPILNKSILEKGRASSLPKLELPNIDPAVVYVSTTLLSDVLLCSAHDLPCGLIVTMLWPTRELSCFPKRHFAPKFMRTSCRRSILEDLGVQGQASVDSAPAAA